MGVDGTSSARGARALALWSLAAGFVGALLTGLSAASWLQGGLRLGCSWANDVTADGGGSWVCDGGIALIVPGVAILTLGLVSALIAAGIVLYTWRRARASAWLVPTMAVVAVAPTVVTCVVLVEVASGRTPSDLAAGAPATRVDLWMEWGLPPLLAMLAGSLLASIGLWMRVKGKARRLAAALVIVALVLFAVAAVLSMLGTMSLGIIAASIVAAGWSVAATTLES